MHMCLKNNQPKLSHAKETHLGMAKFVPLWYEFRMKIQNFSNLEKN